MSVPSNDLFREEAVEHHAAGLNRHGHVLRIHPRWTSVVYWFVVACVAATVVFGSVVRVHDYAGRPAIVRAEGRTVLTAFASGKVVWVAVQPGQAVTHDTVVVRLDDSRGRAELDRIDREIELQTRTILFDLSNQDAPCLAGSPARKTPPSRIATA